MEIKHRHVENPRWAPLGRRNELIHSHSKGDVPHGHHGWIYDKIVNEESDEDRDARFKDLNNRIWGEGNWIRCSTCPHDSKDREVYHHKDAHN